jgi:site-specific recombinase XerC
MRGSSVPVEKHIQDNPLEFHLRMFAGTLQEAGYRDRTMCSKLRLIADLGHWLKRSGQLFASHLEDHLLEAFVKHKQRMQQMHGGDSKTLQQFLAHLRKQGVVSDRKPIPDQSPLAVILDSYEQHLLVERKLSSATIFNYLSFARRLLIERFSKGPLLLKEIEASDISDFVLRRGRTMGVGTAQIMTTAFRSFFRYLFQKGELQADLAACVPAVAAWRLSTVPKYVTPEEVERVLKACNRKTTIGRRDYAVLLLVARLGLRAGEVVALQLEDINWRAGEILVRGKGLLHERMPLPADVGEALASYLRQDRLPCQTRRVFVCTRAPRRGFVHSCTVSTIICRALLRADLNPPVKGAHLFRHSLATSLLRSGATMDEIGEVLRHRDSATTEIYAKVDFDGLRSVAHPWPIGGAQ